MKNILRLVVVLAVLASAGYKFLPTDIQRPTAAGVAQKNISTEKPHESDIAIAYRQQLQDVLLEGAGKVIKILADDNEGSRHQRFILRMPEGFTVLVAHNIDLAPRVANITQGDSVEFYGEYVWNEKGGVVHWTHRDPRGRHVSGWLKHNGVTYQ